MPKISPIWPWFIGAVALIAFISVINLETKGTAIDSGPSTATVKVIPLQVPAGLGLPIRLKIPSINVDAAVEYVGVLPDGSMDVPKGPSTVGWFQFGPSPGETGSAVIAGHFGWKDRTPAVFDNLYTLKTGDKLYVIDDNGRATTFLVRGIRLYDPKSDSRGVFISNDGKAHLNLVTCEGVWDPTSKSYSKRLVVFTDRE